VALRPRRHESAQRPVGQFQTTPAFVHCSMTLVSCCCADTHILWCQQLLFSVLVCCQPLQLCLLLLTDTRSAISCLFGQVRDKLSSASKHLRRGSKGSKKQQQEQQPAAAPEPAPLPEPEPVPAAAAPVPAPAKKGWW
jgi:hypothetical protein